MNLTTPRICSLALISGGSESSSLCRVDATFLSLSRRFFLCRANRDVGNRGHPRVPGPPGRGGRVINNSRLAAAELHRLSTVSASFVFQKTAAVVSVKSLSGWVDPRRSPLKSLSDYLYATSLSDIWLRDVFVQHDIITVLTFSRLMLHKLFCIVK